MSISKYQIFLKTVQCGNFSKAAQALNFTQSGVSHAVQALEALSALPECTGRVVLLPYRAVGVTGALLPAFRPDSVKIDGAAEPMLLALSAQALTSDGAFAMVLPPKS